MLRFLSLAILLVVTANAVNNLQFFFHFTCQPWDPSIKTWKHYIVMEEWDRFTGNDVWYEEKTFIEEQVGQNNTVVHFTVESKKDQWLSAGYEPYLRISHTCTFDGKKIVYLELWPTKLIPIGAPFTSLHAYFDLTMKEGLRDPDEKYYTYDSTPLTFKKFEMLKKTK